jgi:iron-sulfur cluster assembly accessory protein
MVALTENAANEIKRELTFVPGAEISVRVGLEAGGCAGTKYVLTPGATRQPNDLATKHFGVTVLVDPISLTSVEGLEIDFVDALMGGGFKFANPNAARSCGCGESFKAVETGASNNA